MAVFYRCKYFFNPILAKYWVIVDDIDSNILSFIFSGSQTNKADAWIHNVLC